MPEVTIQGVDVFEAESRAYTSKTGKPATFSTVVFKYGGKIFKLPFDASKLPLEKLLARVGKKTVFTLEMSTFGDSISPDFRIVDAGDK